MQSEHPRERREDLELQLAAFFPAQHMVDTSRASANPYTFRILTVCTGNVCRSPLAEALLRDRLSDTFRAITEPSDFLAVESHGLGALVGAAADPQVRMLARALGTNLDAHVARQFDPDTARTANLILTATHEQRAMVAKLAPLAAPRTFTLLEFARLLRELSDSGSLSAPPSPLHRPSRLSRHLRRTIAEVDAVRGSAPPAAPDADDIDDPYQRDGGVHQSVARTIDDAVHTIASILRTVVDP